MAIDRSRVAALAAATGLAAFDAPVHDRAVARFTAASRAVRAHLKPFVRWIWLGALLMALGGFVTAADRRFRRIPEKP